SPFTITLSNVGSGTYTFSAQGIDNEGESTLSIPVTINVTNAPVFQLSQAHYEVNESSGAFAVTVRRNASAAATVTFATANATARALLPGSLGNYYAVSNQLVFADGEFSKDVSIQLVNDLVYRGDKVFRVRLVAPSSGWSLAEPSEATVR